MTTIYSVQNMQKAKINKKDNCILKMLQPDYIRVIVSCVSQFSSLTVTALHTASCTGSLSCPPEPPHITIKSLPVVIDVDVLTAAHARWCCWSDIAFHIVLLCVLWTKSVDIGMETIIWCGLVQFISQSKVISKCEGYLAAELWLSDILKTKAETMKTVFLLWCL